MSEHPTSALIDVPDRKQRRCRPGRLLSRTGTLAIAGIIGLGLTAVGATAAHADTIPNSPTVQLADCDVPSQPANVYGGAVLPTTTCAVGVPANILMTGSASDSLSYALTANTGTETQASTSIFTGASDQNWYFQRIGYVGVIAPTMPALGPGEEMAVPVYRIITYYGSQPVCLQAGGADSMEPTVDSTVQATLCNPFQWNQTNQLWAVGTPGLTNDFINAQTGAFDGNSGYEVYNQALQWYWESGEMGESVIENLYSLTVNGWSTSNSPVLSASYTYLSGENSGLDLGELPLADTSNSTFDIVQVPVAPPGPCAGLNGYALLYCEL